MRDTIDMAREVYGAHTEWSGAPLDRLEQLVAIVRADERNSWPAEMEAMERQVNILTDALAAEREACAKVCEEQEELRGAPTWHCAAAIRARGETK
jgi:acyl carrier protein phosphodiesterase